MDHLRLGQKLRDCHDLIIYPFAGSNCLTHFEPWSNKVPLAILTQQTITFRVVENEKRCDNTFLNVPTGWFQNTQVTVACSEHQTAGMRQIKFKKSINALFFLFRIGLPMVIDFSINKCYAATPTNRSWEWIATIAAVVSRKRRRPPMPVRIFLAFPFYTLLTIVAPGKCWSIFVSNLSSSWITAFWHWTRFSACQQLEVHFWFGEFLIFCKLVIIFVLCLFSFVMWFVCVILFGLMLTGWGNMLKIQMLEQLIANEDVG